MIVLYLCCLIEDLSSSIFLDSSVPPTRQGTRDEARRSSWTLGGSSNESARFHDERLSVPGRQCCHPQFGHVANFRTHTVWGILKHMQASAGNNCVALYGVPGPRYSSMGSRPHMELVSFVCSKCMGLYSTFMCLWMSMGVLARLIDWKFVWGTC